MSLLIRSILLGSFLLLTGCGTFSGSSPQAPEQLQLLPPKSGPSEVLIKQKVTMDVEGQRRQFLAVLKLQQEKTQMVALLPTGQQVLLLSYDGEELKQESFLEVDVPGREILAMMQFALWPEDTVLQFYSPELGWLVNMDQRHRQMDNVEGTLIEVTFQKDGLVLQNHVRNYKVLIETLEAQHL